MCHSPHCLNLLHQSHLHCHCHSLLPLHPCLHPLPLPLPLQLHLHQGFVQDCFVLCLCLLILTFFWLSFFLSCAPSNVKFFMGTILLENICCLPHGLMAHPTTMIKHLMNSKTTGTVQKTSTECIINDSHVNVVVKVILVVISYRLFTSLCRAMWKTRNYVNSTYHNVWIKETKHCNLIFWFYKSCGS